MLLHKVCRFLVTCPGRWDYTSLTLCIYYPSQATGRLAMKHTVAFVCPDSLALVPTMAIGLCSSQLNPLSLSFLITPSTPQVSGSSILTFPAVRRELAVLFTTSLSTWQR